MSRLESMEKEVDGLILGRASTDVLYQGLEIRQLEDREHITQLRQEMPELFDRAQMSQEGLAVLGDRTAIVEGKELATLLQVRELTALVTSLLAQIRDL